VIRRRTLWAYGIGNDGAEDGHRDNYFMHAAPSLATASPTSGSSNGGCLPFPTPEAAVEVRISRLELEFRTLLHDGPTVKMRAVFLRRKM
jgi:hypothetical protein